MNPLETIKNFPMFNTKMSTARKQEYEIFRNNGKNRQYDGWCLLCRNGIRGAGRMDY
jgi:hypothetical protein